MRALRDEWPTLALLVACYLLWAVATTVLAAAAPWLAVPVTALAVAFHSSLQHEALHGHPFGNPTANAALVFPALSVLVPYLRFRDTHLAHHHDARLTDPYDDPESNYLDPAVWHRLPGPLRVLLRANNTLLGRMAFGPAISLVSCLREDARAIAGGDSAVLRGWLWHVPALAPVALWLGTVGAMSAPAYLLAAYLGLSLLKIRTFLEHRAHDHSAGRTVVVEDRGPLALLFLNNNFHLVHHMHPTAPWYRLPGLYAADRARYLGRNHGYVYRSYGEVIRRHFLRAKDPVPHPLWPDRT